MKENPYEKDTDAIEAMRSGGIPLRSAKEDMTFDEWVMYGVDRQWNSVPICNTHDKFPDVKEDVCQHYMLLYKNRQAGEDVRKEFKPAIWRHNTREYPLKNIIQDS
jgi:hypothetical protein|tara:strand:- start:2495 stop:2812 length:318 start_codon:yes stop_codon:yes gene_type:complete